jgi:hypothetical protein
MGNKKDPARGTGFFAPAEGYRSVAHLLDRAFSLGRRCEKFSSHGNIWIKKLVPRVPTELRRLEDRPPAFGRHGVSILNTTSFDGILSENSIRLGIRIVR